jgi:hypothetical protein
MISSCNGTRDRKTDNVEASNADNTAVGGNSRKVRNSHCITQIPNLRETQMARDARQA